MSCRNIITPALTSIEDFTKGRNKVCFVKKQEHHLLIKTM